MENGTLVFIFAAMALFCYFLPTVIAAAKGRVNCFAIFVLNLFVGWTLIGWIGTLIWALTEGRRSS